MTHDETPLRGWTLLKGKLRLRAGDSLAGLAAARVENGSSKIYPLLERLAKIKPLADHPEHFWAHAHTCAQRARRVVRNSGLGLGADESQGIVSSYEAGLINGLEGLAFSFDPPAAGGLSDHELCEVATISYRHGQIIRQWWSSYAAVVETFLG